MSATIRWHGNRVMQQQVDRLRSALMRAAIVLHTHARQLCSTPARRETRRRQQDTSAGQRGSTYTVYHPSRPGQPPALRSGFGRSAITWWMVDDQTARVGIRANGTYMAYLETGTRRIARRPWLSRALDERRQQIVSILRAAMR